MSDNLIKFPVKKSDKVVDIPTPESVKEKLTALTNENVDSISSMIQVEVFNLLEEVGFPVTDDVFFDACFISEAIRSYIARVHGLPHSLQDFSRNIFRYDEDDPDKIRFLSPQFTRLEKVEETEEKPE